jgi:thymidylate kinase
MGTEKPLFIVVEGIDRVGKDVQSGLLAHWLRTWGKARKLSTPNYKSCSGKLVDLYLKDKVRLAEAAEDPAGSRSADRSIHDALVLECLMIADRYAVAHQVRAELAGGSHVVCVRWWPSALVYGHREGIDASWIRDACSSLPVPDLNILLDAEPPVGRLDPENRYEFKEVQEDLRRRYLALWGLEKSLDDRYWVVVDAGAKVNEVANHICRIVVALYPRFGGGSS